MNFIQHVVSEIDETLIQRCVICGEVIEDYSNAVFVSTSNEPVKLGWKPGSVFISGTNPRVAQTFISENDSSKICSSN